MSYRVSRVRGVGACLVIFFYASVWAEGLCHVRGWAKVGLNPDRKVDRSKVYRQHHATWAECLAWCEDDILEKMEYWGVGSQREQGRGRVSYHLYSRILRADVTYFENGKAVQSETLPKGVLERWLDRWLEDEP